MAKYQMKTAFSDTKLPGADYRPTLGRVSEQRAGYLPTYDACV